VQIRSLGYRTDLLFASFDAEVVDHGRYLSVRTPTNPTYYWGNFLLFDQPPVEGDIERWQALFAQEIGSPPEVGHIALGWDSVDGDPGVVQPFLNAGYVLDETIVLTASEVCRPPKFCPEAKVRPISEDWEWQAVMECQVACREEIYSEAGYRAYLEPKMERYRRMVAAGLGQWFGAFIDGQLAGDLGLFVFDGLGRFQSVETHPDFRRRGVCGALVYESAQYGLQTLGAETLVMLADAHYHAAKIYESIGFAPTERAAGLTLMSAG